MQPHKQWEIDPFDFLERLRQNHLSFCEMLQPGDLPSVTRVIPLRSVARVLTMHPMSKEVLRYLLRQIPTRSGDFPFAVADIEVMRIDPVRLHVGQRYIYREKYQSLLEGLEDLFKDFAYGAGGVANLGAYYIFGEDRDGRYVLSCYLPPIIEVHNRIFTIMDGVHRSYLARQTGTSQTVLVVEPVSLPFPCGVRPWDEVSVISLADRPKKAEDRYFGLATEYFRDLSHLGIDG